MRFEQGARVQLLQGPQHPSRMKHKHVKAVNVGVGIVVGVVVAKAAVGVAQAAGRWLRSRRRAGTQQGHPAEAENPTDNQAGTTPTGPQAQELGSEPEEEIVAHQGSGSEAEVAVAPQGSRLLAVAGAAVERSSAFWAWLGGAPTQGSGSGAVVAVEGDPWLEVAINWGFAQGRKICARVRRAQGSRGGTAAHQGSGCGTSDGGCGDDMVGYGARKTIRMDSASSMAGVSEEDGSGDKGSSGSRDSRGGAAMHTNGSGNKNSSSGNDSKDSVGGCGGKAEGATDFDSTNNHSREIGGEEQEGQQTQQEQEALQQPVYTNTMDRERFLIFAFLYWLLLCEAILLYGGYPLPGAADQRHDMSKCMDNLVKLVTSLGGALHMPAYTYQ